MGVLGLGASYGSQSGTSSSSGTSSTTFSPMQAALQSSLGSAFGSLVPSLASGSTPADVTKMETGSADSINKTDSGLTDRITKFLSSRGFGSSGKSGKVALSGELQRESDLATNSGNYASTALNYGNNLLTQALAYAFQGTGQTEDQQGKSHESGFGLSAKAGIGLG